MTAISPRLKRSDLKRTAILDAATDAFGAHGFELANLDAIAEAAAVSKRTIYKQFDSKEGLFLAVVRQLLERVTALHPSPPLADTPLADQLFVFAKAKVAAMLEDPSWSALMSIILSALVQNPTIARQMLQTYQAEDDWLTEWFKAAANSGQLCTVDPGRAHQLFWATIWGAVLWPRVTGLQSDPAREEATIKDIVDLFIRPVTPSPLRPMK
jgi:TetR/AcrR family transcriptional regulator, regulator of autoinduction and epiphytic fitness